MQASPIWHVHFVCHLIACFIVFLLVQLYFVNLLHDWIYSKKARAALVSECHWHCPERCVLSFIFNALSDLRVTFWSSLIWFARDITYWSYPVPYFLCGMGNYGHCTIIIICQLRMEFELSQNIEIKIWKITLIKTLRVEIRK